MWISLSPHSIKSLCIKKHLKQEWLNFFNKNIALKTLKTSVSEILTRFDNNIFRLNMQEAHKSYSRIVLLLLKESQEDVNNINLDKFLSSFDADPQRILLLPDSNNYRVVKESAKFLQHFNKEIKIDLNSLPNLTTAHPSLQTQEYIDFLDNCKFIFKEFVFKVKDIQSILNKMEEDTMFEIDTSILLRWEIIDTLPKNSETLKIFESIIEQKIINPAMTIKYNQAEVFYTLFEYLMMKPFAENIEVAKLLFFQNMDMFNIEESIQYFKNKFEKENTKTYLNNHSFSKEFDNFCDMINVMEKINLKNKLLLNLTEKEKGSGSNTKI